MLKSRNVWTTGDYLLVTIVMGLMGAFYWAIRGTTGYGGETGGMLAGFGWALFWYAFSQNGTGAERRPYNQPWLLLAISLGIAFGGYTGYGVYISWLNGRFHLNYPEGVRDVPAWTGYAMLFLCGLHWGGNTGCFMAWCSPHRGLHARDWAARIACGVLGALGMYAFVHMFPQLFLPFYAEGIYEVPDYATCQRSLATIREIAPHLGLFLGFFAYEIVRGDWRAVALILTVALGFAIPFTVGGYWQTRPYPSIEIDWWKNWEMTIGLGGGLSLGLAFWLFNRPGDKHAAPLSARARAFFRTDLILCFASANVVQGAYDGWCEIHNAAPVISGYAFLALATLILLLAARTWRWVSESPEAAAAPYRLSMRAVIAFQAFIIAAGWLVTIPAEWRFANTFLVLMYTGCIGVSLIMVGLLRYRQIDGT